MPFNIFSGRSVEGASAGVCIFTRKSHLTSPVDECVIADSALGHDPMILRWVPVVLRLKGGLGFACRAVRTSSKELGWWARV